MATDIGEVQTVSPRSGEYGEYAYVGDRWITLIYRTEAEAQAARGIIKGAVAGVIDAAYGSKVPHTMRRGELR